MQEAPSVVHTRNAGHSCPQCSKTYQQKAHLQRHIASHGLQRPHKCGQCRSAFQRSDVLRRHEKTCIGGQVVTTPTQKRACDACTRGKIACDLQHPCEKCERRGKACTYNLASRRKSFLENPLGSSCFDFDDSELQTKPFVHTQESFSLLPSYDFSEDMLDLVADTSQWSRSESLGGEVRGTLQFLDRFTRNEGLISSFDCGTEQQRELVYADAAVEASNLSSVMESTLRDRCLEIIALVKEVVNNKLRNSAITFSWSSGVQDQCARFFSAGRLHTFLELYWAIWSPNIPFLHRPTFDIATVKAGLLAALAIMGASVSPNAADGADARFWYNCVEEIVFQNDDFCLDHGMNQSRPPSKAVVQALQAAYTVCLFQNWEGSESSRGRIRRFRFSTLVAVARDAGIHHARHPIYRPHTFPAFKWTDFVVREELIRVLLWIFLIDTAFVIFNNVPPRMAIKEMRMHFASSEASFQAGNRELCYQELMHHSATDGLVLSAFCETISRELLSNMQVATLAELGSLNLFVITSAFHPMIFHSQQSFAYDVQLKPIRASLENWVRLWEQYTTSAASKETIPSITAEEASIQELWRRIGFSRYAADYWMLAKLIVDRLSEKAEEREAAGSAEPYTTVVKQENISDDLLGKYDETSMRQVNDLISEFKKVVL